MVRRRTADGPRSGNAAPSIEEARTRAMNLPTSKKRTFGLVDVARGQPLRDFPVTRDDTRRLGSPRLAQIRPACELGLAVRIATYQVNYHMSME